MQFGTLKTGEIITAESEIVKAFLVNNPDFSVELAIATILTKEDQAPEVSEEVTE